MSPKGVGLRLKLPRFAPQAALVVLALLLSPQAWAVAASEHLERLHRLELDPDSCYRVRDLFLEKEDAKFYFMDGYLLFARPLAGRAVAALFVAVSPSDQGEILVIPPTRRERQSLARFTSEPVLNEKFRTALMLFTDNTASRLRTSLREGGPYQRDAEVGRDLAEKWTPVMRNILEGLALRTLVDVVPDSPPDSGYFAAILGGGPRGRFEVAMDPRLEEDLAVGQAVWRDGRRFYEVWCRFPSRRRREGHGPGPKQYGHLGNYRIESHLADDLNMRVVARATLAPGSDRDRVIAFELSRRLVLSELRLDSSPVEFLQFEEPASSDVRRRQNNLVAMVLPQPLSPESRHELEFHYEGRVISEAGDGIYYVGSRGSWYPRLQTRFADYDLVFHHPDTMDLVATGTLMETSTQDGVRTSRFRTPAPIRLAGFNLGHYERASKQIGEYIVEVCANLEVEESLRPAPRAPTVWIDPTPGRRRRGDISSRIMIAPPRKPEPPRPAARLDEVAARSAEAVSYFLERFGPPPLKHITISPIPAAFGQGFAGLVYASTLSYFGPQDAPLKSYSSGEQLFYTELLLTHEIAHQWWGNVVTTYSSSDVWIMEALATYSSLLFLEHREGSAVMNEVLANYKDLLLKENQQGQTTESAGAIVLGERLRSSQLPNAAQVIVYDKGAWIIHMLRGIMGDKRFFAFLRSLTEEYAFQDLRTDSFRRLAARYLPNDWPDPELVEFFDQWVYGTGIPSAQVTYEVQGKAPRFRFLGRLVQQEVPEWFSAPIPVEIHTLPGRSLLKWIKPEGQVTEFSVVLRNKPSRVEVDPHGVVLLQQRR